jgi:hypothetical protein
MICLDCVFLRLLNIVVLGYGFDVHITWEIILWELNKNQKTVTPAYVNRNSNLSSKCEIGLFSLCQVINSVDSVLSRLTTYSGCA